MLNLEFSLMKKFPKSLRNLTLPKEKYAPSKLTIIDELKHEIIKVDSQKIEITQ